MSKITKVSELLGKTLSSVSVNERDDEITFTLDDGRVCKMWHDQDCCESVDIDDICGSLDVLIGSPLTIAEEYSSDDPPKREGEESYTWTFYRFATVKGVRDDPVVRLIERLLLRTC